MAEGGSDGGRGRKVGTPQGSSISPLLANVYLHYALDLWVAAWRGRARGGVFSVGFGYDAVLGFENRDEAEIWRRELQEQLREVGLELHPEKTRLMEFGRFAERNRKRRGEGKPETVDLLGFTHMCGRTRTTGRFTVKRKDDRQADARETAGNPAEVAATHARCGSGDGEVAAVGRAGLLQLSRGSWQRETASSVPRCGYPVLAADVTPSEPA